MKRKHVSECGCCGSATAPFIFNVRHRGIYRRLCTSCVLKNHPGLFCPICFQVYSDHPPPPHTRAICLNCPSISHLSCAANNGNYQCPPCKNPTFLFFDIAKSHNKINAAHAKSDLTCQDQTCGDGESVRIDEHLAKQLMAAAQIALESMNKAVVVARVEAERRVKEAAVARKRAREALERVAYLVSKEEIGSKSLIGELKGSPKMGNSFLAGNPIQNQIRENGQFCNGEGEKKVNGLHPVTRH